MAPLHRSSRAVWPFWRFFLTASHFLPQLWRYHGMYACKIDPPDTQASPPMQVCLCSAQERDPPRPDKGLFGGSNFINIPSFFKENLFCWRTTTADRPVAPLPHHKPKFSIFGSASPKWLFNAEPQRHQFRTGDSSHPSSGLVVQDCLA